MSGNCQEYFSSSFIPTPSRFRSKHEGTLYSAFRGSVLPKFPGSVVPPHLTVGVLCAQLFLQFPMNHYKILQASVDIHVFQGF